MKFITTIATTLLFGLISIGVGAAQCEACPFGQFHCETSTESDPPGELPEYDWKRNSGPGGWYGDNGYNYRQFRCNGGSEGSWTGEVWLYPGGNFDTESVGGLCSILA